ncbi:MAG: hypothetical protein EBX52_05515, partial [Proteobacteria bacterium]|nr:hypothetical protein [Pseudomonadota bacterium]
VLAGRKTDLDEECRAQVRGSCENLDLLGKLSGHLERFAQNNLVTPGYIGLNTPAPDDPDQTIAFKTMFDRVYGIDSSSDGSWLDSLLSGLSALGARESNPNLEAVYQRALLLAKADFLNSDDMAMRVRDMRDQVQKLKELQDSRELERFEVDLKAMKDLAFQDAWNRSWDTALSAAADGPSCSRVDCSIDVLIDYLSVRGGQPPLPDLTLIGSEEAKKLKDSI